MAKYNLTEKKSKAPLYRSLLNADMIEDLFEKIMAKFVVEKKYRDPDYSAKEMADELGTNTRYISAVINMRYQDNYSQMVNEFRIKEAMYLLKNFHSRKMTMDKEQIHALSVFKKAEKYFNETCLSNKRK